MRSLKILVVDDNKKNCDLLCNLFCALSHQAEKVYDGPSALLKVAEWVPDIILLDIEMPGMLGWEVCRKLRAIHTNHFKIYALTGLADKADIQRSLDSGMDHHFVKPLDIDYFWEVLNA